MPWRKQFFAKALHRDCHTLDCPVDIIYPTEADVYHINIYIFKALLVLPDHSVDFSWRTRDDMFDALGVELIYFNSAVLGKLIP